MSYAMNVLPFMRDVKVIVDIGAHHGDFAEALLCVGAEIYCLEPYPYNFEMLSKRLSGRTNVKLFNYGISSFSGRILMFDDCPSTLCSFEERWPREEFKDLFLSDRTLEVGVKSWTAFLLDIGKHPDFVKIDCEGHDTVIIREILKHGFLPRFLMFEANLKKDDVLLGEILANGYHEIARWSLDAERGRFDIFYEITKG